MDNFFSGKPPPSDPQRSTEQDAGNNACHEQFRNGHIARHTKNHEANAGGDHWGNDARRGDQTRRTSAIVACRNHHGQEK